MTDRNKPGESKTVQKFNWTSISIIIAILSLVLSGLSYNFFVSRENAAKENLKSQVYSSIQKADSLYEAGLFEEAIGEYENILNTISSKIFPDEYAAIQNNLGNAYSSLAEMRDKEPNIRRTINAYQEALKIFTVERYPSEHATVQNNLGTAYTKLAEVRDTESNIEKAIDAHQKALNI